MNEPTVRELFDLSGKVALVTGGARNLGYDMALALAEAGAAVAITSRQIENAAASAKRAKSCGASRSGRSPGSMPSAWICSAVR